MRRTPPKKKKKKKTGTNLFRLYPETRFRVQKEIIDMRRPKKKKKKKKKRAMYSTYQKNEYVNVVRMNDGRNEGEKEEKKIRSKLPERQKQEQTRTNR